MLPTCQMNETKLEVNENYEETELSDVDDDLFVRTGGRNGFRLEFNDIAKKPLMTPRRRKSHDYHLNGFHTQVRSSPPAFRVLCMPICYIILSTFALLGLIAVIAFLSHFVSFPKGWLKIWKKNSPGTVNMIAPCDNIKVEDVWVKQFPKLLTESAFRTVDVNSDGIEDVIFGYATGADGYNVPNFVCDIYFQSQPCFGGVLCLDGATGNEIWRHWTEHEVFALNCEEDINKDGISDCLVSGRAGVFKLLSGVDGKVVWTFSDRDVRNPIMNIYTAQFIRDISGDGIPDVLAIHGGDPLAEPNSKTRLTGRIVLLNGKSGTVLQWIETPDHQESYYSPQILTKDGTDFVLFGTGGETHGGGLYVISMSDLYKGFSQNVQTIYKDVQKGIMVPPVIVDINRDGVYDIVMAMFNSTVIAFDGVTYLQLWNYSFPSSETYTSPTPGYYNDDSIVDFLVKYQTGPGFPVYYHAQTTVLDGRNGKPLFEKPLFDSIGSQASTPLIRVQGYGNDIFLYWSSNCKGFEGNFTHYTFAKGTNIHEQSRSDFCKLRFDSTFINQLRAFNQATGLPGALIYDSEARSKVEHATIDTSMEGQTFLQQHPEMWRLYEQDSQDSNQQDLSETQSSQGAMINDVENGRNILKSRDPYASQMQYLPYNIPLQRPYNIPQVPLSSQPELTENVMYPQYHTVRKHGPDLTPININRRGRLDDTKINNRKMGSFNHQLDSQNQYEGLQQFSGVNDALSGSIYDLNIADATKGKDFAYETLRRKPTGDSTLSFSQWGYTNGLNGKFSGGKRSRRHIGAHDNDGIQRIISTGTLAKPLNKTASSSETSGIDLIFATYWIYPAKTEAILLKSPDCIQKKMLEETLRFDETSKYYGMDHDLFEDTVTNECRHNVDQDTPSDHTLPDSPADDDTGNNIYESQATYNPFNIKMGQMTVYRVHISCSCSESILASKTGDTKRRCGKILEDQPWSGYLGSHSDSYFPYRSRSPTTENPKGNAKA